DSVWLEVGTIVFDKTLLDNRHSLDEMTKHLVGPEYMDFLSEVIDFARDDVPRFNLRYNSQRNFLIRVFRDLFGSNLVDVDSVSFLHGGDTPIEIDPDVTVTPEGLISVVLTDKDKKQLVPGMYTVEF